MHRALLLVLLPSLVWAQESESSPSSQPASRPAWVAASLEPPASAPTVHPEPPPVADALPSTAPNPETAFKLSLLSTMTIPILGQIAGPSVGHFYAGERRRALITTGARLTLGVTALLFFSDDPPGFGGVTKGRERRIADRIGGVAAVGFGGLFLYDLWDVALGLPRRLEARR
jgi:hypothetical protein